MIAEPNFHLLDGQYKILQAGDTLEETDLYWSSQSKWLPVPCPGCVIQEEAEATFVRPYFEGNNE